MKRIGILGIGGVGGFVSQALIKEYAKNSEIELVLICRGETKEQLIENGLRFKSGEDEVISYQPKTIEEDPEKIGILDLMIIATKSYDLQKVVKKYKSCLDANSIVLPLQNMLNAKQEILEAVPTQATVLDACIYLISNVVEPGLVHHVGGPGNIKLGGGTEEKRQVVVDFLSEAGLDVKSDDGIEKAIWLKFLFVSPVAAITTAFKLSLGELSENMELQVRRKAMMKEIQALAATQKIEISDDDIEDAYELLTKFPFESRSSMQLDFEKRNRQTEKFYMINYVINACKNAEVPCPHYESIDKIIKAFFRK